MEHPLFILVIVAGLVTAGCSGSISPQSFGQVPAVAHFGSDYSDSGQTITVYSAQKSRILTSTSDNLSSSKEAAGGKNFVIIEAQIKNTGDERIAVFPHRFSIVDSEGNRFEKAPYHGEGWLMACQLDKNQYRKGKIVFEVPENAKNLFLYYDLNGRHLSWEIT